MLSDLVCVAQQAFHVVAQQLTLQHGEILRCTALEKRIDTVKIAVHAGACEVCPFLAETPCHLCEHGTGLNDRLDVAFGPLRVLLATLPRNPMARPRRSAE